MTCKCGGTPIYCKGMCRRCYNREYRNRPEAKAATKARLQRPEVKAQRAMWAKRRYHRPDVREQYLQYWIERRADPEVLAAKKVADRLWRERNPEKKSATDAVSRKRRSATPEGREKDRIKTRHRRALRLAAEGTYSLGEFTALGKVCVYCGIECEAPDADHIIPLSRGGTNWISNIAPACPTCNRSKQDMTGDEFRASRRLRRRLARLVADRAA